MAIGMILLSQAGSGSPAHEYLAIASNNNNLGNLIAIDADSILVNIASSTSSRHYFDLYLWGYLFLACSGPLVYVGALSTVVNSASALALLTAALDASAIVFPLFRVVNWQHNVSSEAFFSYYLLVPLLLLLGYSILRPVDDGRRRFSGLRPTTTSSPQWQPAQHELETTYNDYSDNDNNNNNSGDSNDNNNINETNNLLDGYDDDNNNDSDEHLPSTASTWTSSYELTMRHPLKDTSGLWGVMHDRPFWQQVGSTWFVLAFVFAGVAVIRVNFFISTVWRQYSYLLGSSWSKGAQVSSALEWALPLGGIVVSPVVGIMLDRISTFKSFTVLVVLSLATGLLNTVPNYTVAIMNVVLFVVYRPLLLTAISDYTVRVFGLTNFNAVYGFMWLLIGLLNFTQVSLDSYYVWNFENDPFWFNIYLTVITTVVGAALVAYIFFQGKKIRRKQLEDEARSAPIQPMPGSAGYFP